MPDNREMESLNCSLCLDVFEEATLLNCGHSFCRKCLVKYDQCHPQQDNPVSLPCPLCRQTTGLGASGIAGLPPNVSINGLVDEVNTTSNPFGRLYEERPICSNCKKRASDGDTFAVAFCYDCESFLCQPCRAAHELLIAMFADHRIVDVKEFLSGNIRVESNVDMCSEHRAEKREFFCVDCRVIICHKCTIVKHNVRDHVIRERGVFEREIREKIDGLLVRCKTERKVLESNIKGIEQERKEVGESLEALQESIDEAFDDIIRRLQQRKVELKKEVKGMRGKCNEKLDTGKAMARKLAAQLSGSADMLAQGRRGGLEGDSLVSHDHLCEELGGLLQTCHDWNEKARGTAWNVASVARRVRFDRLKTDTRIGEIGVAKWTMWREIPLPHDEPMNALSVVSRDEVMVGYLKKGADKFSVDGNRTPFVNDLVNKSVRAVAVLSDGRIAITDGGMSPPVPGLRLYDAQGCITKTRFETYTECYTKLDCDKFDNIFVLYQTKDVIHVFSPAGGNPLRTIELQMTAVPYQVHTTQCGRIMLASSGGVRVMSETGAQLAFIQQSPSSELLYPAVDENDVMYISRICKQSSCMSIEEYSLDGSRVHTILDEIKIKIPERHWYCMKCPAPHVIVLCTAGVMYVFKKQYEILNV